MFHIGILPGGWTEMGTIMDYFSPKPDIARLKAKKDYNGLIKALSYHNLDIQWKATEALAALGVEGIDHLLSALNTRNKHIRLGIIEALGEIRNHRAVPPLIDRLKDKDNEIRWEAALALGEIGDPCAIPPLLGALRDTDRYVRYGAAIALEKLAWSPQNPDGLSYFLLGKQEWEALEELGKGAIGPLSHALEDTDRSIRLKAVETLGKIGDIGAIQALYRSLADPEEEVRWQGVIAASRCGIAPQYLPRGLSKRPRNRKNPLVAAFLNFMLPGMGYLYIGKWWGVVVFQIDVYVTLWLFGLSEGEILAWNFLLPVYLILAFHGWFIARQMPDL